MDCINKDESLAELLLKERKLRQELIEVRKKIGVLEDPAIKGTAAIRIM